MDERELHELVASLHEGIERLRDGATGPRGGLTGAGLGEQLDHTSDPIFVGQLLTWADARGDAVPRPVVERFSERLDAHPQSWMPALTVDDLELLLEDSDDWLRFGLWFDRDRLSEAVIAACNRERENFWSRHPSDERPRIEFGGVAEAVLQAQLDIIESEVRTGAAALLSYPPGAWDYLRPLPDVVEELFPYVLESAVGQWLWVLQAIAPAEDGFYGDVDAKDWLDLVVDRLPPLAAEADGMRADVAETLIGLIRPLPFDHPEELEAWAVVCAVLGVER